MNKATTTSAEGLIGIQGIDEETLALVLEEFKAGELQNMIEAEKERRLIAQANAQPVYWRDDFRVTQRVSRRVHNQWILREGKDVWQDDFHQRYFKRHFPECYPKQISPKIQVGYSGSAATAEPEPSASKTPGVFAGTSRGSGRRETTNYGEI